MAEKSLSKAVWVVQIFKNHTPERIVGKRAKKTESECIASVRGC